MCDLRTVSFDVPPQEILTKDSVTVAVDAVVYYKIQQPLSAVINVADYASRLIPKDLIVLKSYYFLIDCCYIYSTKLPLE